MTREQFIQEIAKYVQKYAPKYGIKVCSPVVAQACLESGYGTSELAINANNFFGIKYKVGRCPSASGIYYKDGSEQNADGSYTSSAMQWCKFDSIDACVKGYFDFISHSRYSNLKGVTDPRKYLELIKGDGYATSLQYVDNVYKVITNNNLTRFDDVKEESIVTTVNANLEIRQCLLTNNNCYKQGRTITPKGIVVHSTGANNPSLKRYVQPDDGILGTNPYNNHWNRSGLSKCVHAFIGKDENGDVRIYQTLPWNFRCWGCGSGSKGSYNNSFIQFEICEDSLTDVNYFNKAFKLAIELCAYLAKQYNIPVENIVSHNEANKLGYASNHSDCDHWLKRFGKDMDWFREQVGLRNGVTVAAQSSTRAYLMKGDKGDAVKILQENLNYLGYTCGVADGVFGAKTDTALRKFQKSYKMSVDGKYGVLSKQKLEDAVAKKKSTSTTKYKYKNIDYSPVFDPTYYANNHVDLKKTFGTNATKLFDHYIKYGISEGRRAHAEFDVKVYKANNADLRNAFGNAGYEKYVEHYLHFGKNENRKKV